MGAGNCEQDRAPSAEPLLEVHNLFVQYRGASGPALSDCSLELEACERVGLAGPSGCGKTTLALAVMHILPPTTIVRSTKLLFRGQQLDARAARRLRGKGIALLMQQPELALHPVLPVSAQVDGMLRMHSRLSRAQRKKEVEALLAEVGLHSQLAGCFPHQLSGGEKQRAALAIAVAGRPALLIADEPTSALDPMAAGVILELIGRLAEDRGTAILCISHDRRWLERWASRVVEFVPAA